MEWLMDMLFSPLGMKILAWVGTTGGVLLSTYVLARISSPLLRGMLGRLWGEAKLTALDVHKAYTLEYSKAKADGVVTPEEELVCRQAALDAAKMHFMGKLGLSHLMKIALGVSLDNWLAGKVDAALDEAKKAGEDAVAASPGEGSKAVVGDLKEVK